jgi:hypothetical protein
MKDRPGVRFASARSAVALAALALALAVAALVLCVAAGQSESQLIRTIALLPTVAVGTLVAARRLDPFSAEREGDATTVQAQVLMRANDPLYEMAMICGGHRKEDKFWAATLTALGQRLGVQEPKVETRSTCVDTRRQWRHARNVWHNSMVRSVLQTIAAPFTGRRRGMKRQAGG